MSKRLRTALFRPVPIYIAIGEIVWLVMVVTMMILNRQDPIGRRLNGMDCMVGALFMRMCWRCRQNPELGDGKRQSTVRRRLAHSITLHYRRFFTQA